MHNHSQPRERRAGGENLIVLEHLMAGGEMVAAQLPSPSTWTPEKRLAAAVLSSALVEIRDRGTDPRRRRQIAEDLDWIESDDLDWPFSFARLCQVFGLETEWVREVVRRWRQMPSDGVRRSASVYRQAA